MNPHPSQAPVALLPHPTLAASPPLVVCWGLGQDSTGMLISLYERGIKPDLIAFAGVGSERKGSYEFRPTFDNWLEEHDVWKDIKASGVPYHKAYDLGMPRLSCVFCIFSPPAALMIAGKQNPELLDRALRPGREANWPYLPQRFPHRTSPTSHRRR